MSSFDLGPVRALRPEERDDAPVVATGDLWDKVWTEQRNASNFDAHLKNYSDAFDGIADRVKAATGEALDNPFRSASFAQSTELLATFSREGVDASSPVQGWRQKVQELKTKHPDKLDWDSLIDEPGRVAFETMKKAREESSALAERAGLIGAKDVPGGNIPYVGPLVGSIAALGVNAVRHPVYTGAQLAASFGAQMLSPADAAVNLISFGIGGTAKSIIKNATMNALSNAAGQALLSGPKQISYRDAGLPYGWDVWAEEVGAAAGSGFALDAGIRTPVRAAVSKLGRDTPAGTLFSRNTERGGFLFDAANDATPRPIKGIEIDPETIRKADAGDIAASKAILEKLGALQDPETRFVVDHMENGGQLTEGMLKTLETMGVARPDGMRALANAVAGRPFVMPEAVRQATEPLVPERGAPLLDKLGEVEDQVRRLPQQVQEIVRDGLESGIPSVVRAVEEALAGPRERVAERVAQVIDARTVAQTRLHAGRATPIEMAQSIRQFPDLIDTTVPLEASRVEMARSIARLDDTAFDMAAAGSVPPEVAALVAEHVPKAQQARVIGDVEKLKPQSVAEAEGLIRDLVMPEREPGPDLAGEGRIVEPVGPEATKQTEMLRLEAGKAYEDAMAPLNLLNELEAKADTLRGEIAKAETEARVLPETDVFIRPEELGAKDGEASPAVDIGALRSELAQLEAQLAQARLAANPTPGGRELADFAMQQLARRREADLVAAINQALALADRITPEGTRVEVTGPIRAPDGSTVDATSDMGTGHIQLALAAVDPMAKIGHEAVHTLVTKGHLSPDEVGQLAALAREAKTFADEAKYRDVYADRPNLETLVDEEAAASYIEARIKGAVEGPANTIVERIRQLMERIKQALAGFGFQSKEDVVQAILNGEAARRRPVQEWMRANDVKAMATAPGEIDARVVEQGRAAMQRQMSEGVELPDGTRINGVKLYAIRAFHGSPHDFDRFDLSKIGTGEGAQAYGHGLYFAESEGVARSYRDKLATDFKMDGKPFDDRDPRHIAAYAIFVNGGDRPAAAKGISDQIGWMRNSETATARYQEAARLARDATWTPPQVQGGRMYEVSIKANPEDFLDWDKPLSSQKAYEKLYDHAGNDGRLAEDIMQILEDATDKTHPNYGLTGDHFIDILKNSLQENQAPISQALREAGIPGIKYLDQGSRSAGDGSRNYVVFDDNLIEIVAKDGQPVSNDKLYSLAKEVGATPIEEIGPDDPHPGRVLAYHGTPYDVDKFDPERGAASFGIHFGTAEQASDMASSKALKGERPRVIPVVLNLRNVVTVPDMGAWDPITLVREIEKSFPFVKGLGDEVDAFYGKKGAYSKFSPVTESREFLKRRLTEIGIDGIRYQNIVEGNGGWSYIVWKPDQVFSATSGDKLYSLRSDPPELPRMDAEVGQSMRRSLDSLGYYSKAVEAARGLAQAKGTPEQMLAQMKKAGVKDAEIEATGLKTALDGKKSVTRDEIVRHLEENRVSLNEANYGYTTDGWVVDPLQWGQIGETKRFNNQSDAESYATSIGLSPDHAQPLHTKGKWQSYSLDPSNPTYRETVLHLPTRDFDADLATAERINREQGAEAERAFWDAKPYPELDVTPFKSGHFPEPNIVGHMMTSMTTHKGRPVFTVDQIQSDWGQKLRDGGVRDEAKIADLRAQLNALTSTDAVENARKKAAADRSAASKSEYLRLSSELRRLDAELRNAENSAPGHPLVNTTDQWVNTTLRRAIRQAAEANAAYIAIPSGDTVLSYNPGDANGMHQFYGRTSTRYKVEIGPDLEPQPGRTSREPVEGIVPKNLRKLLTKIDPSIKPERIETLDSPSGKTGLGNGFTLFPLTDTVKWAAKAEGQQMFSLRSDLDMSPEGRKQRAQEMGFDTSRVWYHGTAGSFDAFDVAKAGSNVDLGWLGKGVYFGTDPEQAGYYARIADVRGAPNIIPAYLGMKNPFRYGIKNKGIRGEVYGEPSLPESIRQDVLDRAGFKYNPDAEPDFAAEPKLAQAMRDVLMERGYDGVIADFSKGGSEAVVFDPKNIRSVNADFDPSRSDSPNLMYAMREEEPPIKYDMAVVNRMNQMVELIGACRG